MRETYNPSMVRYRRNLVPGACYFFTVTLCDRRSRLLVEHIGALRAALLAARERAPFAIDAMVVLPDHLHALWTLPMDDADFAGRWRVVKGAFSRALAASGVPLRRLPRGGYALWQPRFWEHTIRDADDYQRHVDYIHINPLKHGLVSRLADWPHSSFHRFVREGLLPADWAGGEVAGGSFGEPV